MGQSKSRQMRPKDAEEDLPKKSNCPGCGSKLTGLVGMFRRSRRCTVCMLVHCSNCTYFVKREAPRNTNVKVKTSKLTETETSLTKC